VPAQEEVSALHGALAALLAAPLAASGQVTPAAAAGTRSVAITFDDLPAAGAKNPDTDAALTTGEIEGINSSILAALRAHRVPATAFVNERGIAGYPDAAARLGILARWIDAGMELGNHTYSHADFNALSVSEFEREVEEGEASIAPLVRKAGKDLLWFRFPMNHTGDTESKREAGARYLAKRGYRVATCTIENEDFEFERAFRQMLAAKDAGAAERLRAEYLRYTAAEIDYYAELHKSLFGRETAQVMILHVNRLNAALAEEILRLFEARHYRFVSLAEAQADSAFKSPDPFVTRFGPMWGYRWARGLGIRVDGTKEPEPPAWILGYGRTGANPKRE
jgi:peptidoglycan/xylan/chitin deacetylase (PgdA/CDA1 family)